MLSKEDLLHINGGYSGKDSSFAHDFGYILGVCGRIMSSIAECYARGAMLEKVIPMQDYKQYFYKANSLP